MGETATQEFLEAAQNNRRLLSVIDLSQLAEADPNSVQEVKEMVEQLIDDGEVERKKDDDAAAAALAELQKQIRIHNDTLNALYWAAGDVKVSTLELNKLIIIGDKATKATKTAQQNFDHSHNINVAKKEAFDFEAARVANEEAIFVEVTNLLK